MKFLKDIPIVSNGLFIYNLNVKKNHSKYYESLEYK